MRGTITLANLPGSKLVWSVVRDGVIVKCGGAKNLDSAIDACVEFGAPRDVVEFVHTSGAVVSV